MIYLDDHIWDFDLQEALAAVSTKRREYALHYHHERDQRLCVAAYRLLQRALHDEYGINELPQFIYTVHGKPLLEGHPDIHFSLSHCNMAVACAVDSQPIGIDVETFDQYSQELAEQVMNEDEMQQILNSPDPAIAFTRLWTMKESYYKLTGDPSSSDIPHLLEQARKYHFDSIIQPNYIATQCSIKLANHFGVID